MGPWASILRGTAGGRAAFREGMRERYSSSLLEGEIYPLRGDSATLSLQSGSTQGGFLWLRRHQAGAMLPASRADGSRNVRSAGPMTGFNQPIARCGPAPRHELV